MFDNEFLDYYSNLISLSENVKLFFRQSQSKEGFCHFIEASVINYMLYVALIRNCNGIDGSEKVHEKKDAYVELFCGTLKFMMKDFSAISEFQKGLPLAVEDWQIKSMSVHNKYVEQILTDHVLENKAVKLHEFSFGFAIGTLIKILTFSLLELNSIYKKLREKEDDESSYDNEIKWIKSMCMEFMKLKLDQSNIYQQVIKVVANAHDNAKKELHCDLDEFQDFNKISDSVTLLVNVLCEDNSNQKPDKSSKKSKTKRT